MSLCGSDVLLLTRRVYQLMKEVIKLVTPQQWKNYVNHAIDIEDRMWEADGNIETLRHTTVVNLNDIVMMEYW